MFIISRSLIFHAVDTALPRMQFTLLNSKESCAKKRWLVFELCIYWSAIIVLMNCSLLVWNPLCCQIKSLLFCWAEGTMAFSLPNNWIISPQCDTWSFFTFHCFANPSANQPPVHQCQRKDTTLTQTLFTCDCSIQHCFLHYFSGNVCEK